MKRLRRICLALALAAGLSLTTAGVSTAAPEAAVDCPDPGTRFKTPTTGDRVFLVGPSEFLYYIPNQTVYFDLWGTWDDIVTLDRSACNKPAYELTNGHFRQLRGSDAVYIWDATWDDLGRANRWRRIADWTTFTTRYHFDPTAIYVVDKQSDIFPIADPTWT
ncbi:hypothetical protein ACFYXF_42465 [Streptomyces sp. NPDC002680]|uniref:hypothetical protein n=1 Tax=Streptomyces sp. NPDC002680 TaxID=3364659 RepID=UPI0036A5188D